jgi:HPt (histidine-containing phosphotransfer) domain-containing protein
MALDGFDVDAALARMGGSVDFYRRMLAKLPNTLGDSVGKIEAALVEGDRRLAERLAHTSAGVAANVGATELAAAAAALETTIRDAAPHDAALLHYQRSLTAVLQAVANI